MITPEIVTESRDKLYKEMLDGYELIIKGVKSNPGVVNEIVKDPKEIIDRALQANLSLVGSIPNSVLRDLVIMTALSFKLIIENIIKEQNNEKSLSE